MTMTGSSAMCNVCLALLLPLHDLAHLHSKTLAKNNHLLAFSCPTAAQMEVLLVLRGISQRGFKHYIFNVDILDPKKPSPFLHPQSGAMGSSAALSEALLLSFIVS